MHQPFFHGVEDQQESRRTRSRRLARTSNRWKERLSGLTREYTDVEIIVERPEDEADTQSSQPLRHEICIRRRSNGHRLVAGVVRESPEDADAEYVAAQKAMDEVGHAFGPTGSRFFICDDDGTFQVCEVTRRPSDPFGPGTTHRLGRLIEDSDIEAELRFAMQHAYT